MGVVINLIALGKLMRTKSGQAAQPLMARKKWVLQNFGFLKENTTPRTYTVETTAVKKKFYTLKTYLDIKHFSVTTKHCTSGGKTAFIALARAHNLRASKDTLHKECMHVRHVQRPYVVSTCNLLHTHHAMHATANGQAWRAAHALTPCANVRVKYLLPAFATPRIFQKDAAVMAASRTHGQKNHMCSCDQGLWNILISLL